jgi:2-amino-4-hydroxy-6-hydroxymethyldihydropteridine diphosphokinase
MSSGSRIVTAAAESVIAYIGIGTNLGERGANLQAAVSMLREFAAVTAVSSIYETDPVGYADQPRFWNVVVQIATSLEPAQLLEELLEIEQRMGRTRSFRNAPRVIDLDILLYGDVVLDVSGLKLPHPRMTERAFVLMPLVELDPELRHPVSGVRFSDVLARGQFEQAERVRPFAELGGLTAENAENSSAHE